MQYCKKHRQPYMDHLHECPICVGETFKPGKRILSPSQPGYKKPKEVKKKQIQEKKSLNNLTKPKSKFKRKRLKPFI